MFLLDCQTQWFSRADEMFLPDEFVERLRSDLISKRFHKKYFNEKGANTQMAQRKSNF
jgi:hypothetical protein